MEIEFKREMKDITEKRNTYREASATATVRLGNKDAMKAVQEGKVPKGNVFEMSKAAALLAVKKTALLLPDCHPIPIEKAGLEFEVSGMEIQIKMTVATIYKTGVEVEAMHGASVAALTLYDMLKPLDREIEIASIKLIEKKGGKSDFKDAFRKKLTSAVIVCSDTVSAGQKEDKAGRYILERVEELGLENKRYEVIPDEKLKITEVLKECLTQKTDLIIFTGGTGLSVRDTTPEAILPILERRIPGIEEAMRAYGQERTPYAMLSRSVAGQAGKSIVIALPGSSGGTSESLNAVFPHILHAFKIIGGGGH